MRESHGTSRKAIRKTEISTSIIKCFWHNKKGREHESLRHRNMQLLCQNPVPNSVQILNYLSVLKKEEKRASIKPRSNQMYYSLKNVELEDSRAWTPQI